jgi:hypothetical protein
MGDGTNIEYDPIGDTLYLERVAPYGEQVSHELPPGILARSNPASGEVESLEMQGLQARTGNGGTIEVPLDLTLRALPEHDIPRRRAV